MATAAMAAPSRSLAEPRALGRRYEHLFLAPVFAQQQPSVSFNPRQLGQHPEGDEEAEEAPQRKAAVAESESKAIKAKSLQQAARRLPDRRSQHAPEASVP